MCYRAVSRYLLEQLQSNLLVSSCLGPWALLPPFLTVKLEGIHLPSPHCVQAFPPKYLSYFLACFDSVWIVSFTDGKVVYKSAGVIENDTGCTCGKPAQHCAVCLIAQQDTCPGTRCRTARVLTATQQVMWLWSLRRLVRLTAIF